MAETILNTRIKLRYASHVDWISSPVILLPGEVALCHITSNNMEVPNSSPTVMFKVGDGTHLFKELPWASARASDVYDWAKKDRIDVERLGTGNVVSSIAWDDDTQLFKLQTISAATSEEFETLRGIVAEIVLSLNDIASRVTTAEGKITELKNDKIDTETFNTSINSLSDSLTELVAGESTRASNEEKRLEGRINEIEKGFILTTDEDDEECLILQQVW